MPVQSTCPGGQGFPTVRPHHDTRALELPRNEASQQGEMWHHCSLHKDSRSCPAGLPSPYLQRLTSLPSDLIPNTLPWAHCSATIGPCCSSNSQGHSCLRNFALAVLSAWCSLFPDYQQGLLLHLLQVFTQMTPFQWCLLSYLRLQSSYIHIYKGKNSVLFITVSCASKSTWHKVKCAIDICGMNVWITVHLILLLIFALKSNSI